MDHREAGAYWERNAEAWTKLSRLGADVYRDRVNTPAFLASLPSVDGLAGLDIGCGEGHNTRLLAARGARMTGVDISTTFVRHAAAVPEPAIPYAAGSAEELPFASGRFDFATAFMSLMDVPNPDAALQEAFRILKPGGFLQFSITHPCFNLPHRRLRRDEAGLAYAVEIGGYFDGAGGRIERWLFQSAPAEAKEGLAPFEIPLFHRPLSDWLNALIGVGFVLEFLGEPRADEATAAAVPAVQDTRVVAYFLHVRARKPQAPSPRIMECPPSSKS